MQLTLDSFSLKPFTKALTCLSKYGDELSIYATPDSLSLSATNASKSAYCRFKYEKLFFSKYNLSETPSSGDAWATEFEDMMSVTGQLMTKSLLYILKHRTVEKTVERCEMSIVEGHQPTDEETPQADQDMLENKLIIRLHCKHGVVKTHRLVLLTPSSLMAPGVPDALNESNLTIGPKAVKDMIEHFPLARGIKSDPQLIWSFGESEVELRSFESSIDSKGKAQLATELTISAEEFDVYNIYAPPTTIAFHLREFNATIAYADSMSLALDLRFTDPAAPLFIDVEGDNSETLFVISTSQVHGAMADAPSQHCQAMNNKKREREETPAQTSNKKPMKAVKKVEARMLSVPRTPGLDPGPSSVVPPRNSAQLSQLSMRNNTMPPPSFIPPRASTPLSRQVDPREPLFLQSSSQLSTADEEILRSSGLGVESMDAEELANLLEGDGEEVAFDFSSQDAGYHKFLERPHVDVGEPTDSFELEDQAGEIPPTQTAVDSKIFQALFED
ncbi:Cell cycle checkpoint control protein RAD9A [Hypsizygus marmoreus]|uniref:Cell cycle checkpoint control protein RAD9A n=1 Tax=Hypsizygus marmoreus TaxID=39966 RepID=A0A369JZW7_HYPMA|nr:Cell cycle checkpoint control protein RAD9A [Hypsizygus marmoreus]